MRNRRENPMTRVLRAARLGLAVLCGAFAVGVTLAGNRVPAADPGLATDPVLAGDPMLTAAAAPAPNGVLPATPPANGAPPAAPAPASEPVAPLRDVGFDQKLGEQVPLDLEFRDETGRTVRLGDLFGGKPVILSLAYYDCPMICALALQGISSSMKPLTFTPGKEFEVVTVSFDPRETPALARLKKTHYLDLYGRPEAEAGWHFLTGDPDAIRRLTQAVGFRYVWDAEQKQFAHPTGIVLLTPNGIVARYIFGIEYSSKDLRLGLIDAAGGRIGTLADKLLLLCYSYDPNTGRYSGLALNMVRAGGVLTVMLLGGFIIGMARRDKARGGGAPGPASAGGGGSRAGRGGGAG